MRAAAAKVRNVLNVRDTARAPPFWHSTEIGSCCFPFGFLIYAGTVVLHISSSSLRLLDQLLSCAPLSIVTKLKHHPDDDTERFRYESCNREICSKELSGSNGERPKLRRVYQPVPSGQQEYTLQRAATGTQSQKLLTSDTAGSSQDPLRSIEFMADLFGSSGLSY